MSQEEIKRRNVEVSYLTRYYKTSPFKSLGQVLSFINVYCGFDVMENCQVGGGDVLLHRKRIVTFNFDEEKKLPIFNFDSGYDRAKEAEERQQILINEVLPNL